MSTRERVIGELAELIASVCPGQCAQIGVDGVDGAGKTSRAPCLGATPGSLI